MYTYILTGTEEPTPVSFKNLNTEPIHNKKPLSNQANSVAWKSTDIYNIPNDKHHEMIAVRWDPEEEQRRIPIREGWLSLDHSRTMGNFRRKQKPQACDSACERNRDKSQGVNTFDAGYKPCREREECCVWQLTITSSKSEQYKTHQLQS